MAREIGLDGIVSAFMDAAVRGRPDRILRKLEEQRAPVGDFELATSFCSAARRSTCRIRPSSLRQGSRAGRAVVDNAIRGVRAHDESIAEPAPTALRQPDELRENPVRDGWRCRSRRWCRAGRPSSSWSRFRPRVCGPSPGRAHPRRRGSDWTAGGSTRPAWLPARVAVADHLGRCGRRIGHDARPDVLLHARPL